MSTNVRLGPSAPPDLTTLLRLSQDELSYRTFCHLPGKIEKFYAADQTADVSISVQRVSDGVTRSYPPLFRCPVFFATGGSTGRITMPVNVGDTCLVAVADRDIDTWWSTGSVAPPLSRRTHDLSDSLVFVGFRHKGNAVSDYSATNVEIKNLGSKISTGTDIKATANGGAKLELATKAKLANSSTDLKTVLDALVNAIIAQVDTSGDTLNAGTIAALNSVKTQIGTLLTS